MALLIRSRRPLAIAMVALLTAPAALLPLHAGNQMSRAENRKLAPAPAAPTTVKALRAWPRAVDGFLADHFGFRDRLIGANNRLFGKARRSASAQAADLTAAIGERSKAVPDAVLAVEGRAGRLFLTQGLLSSTGQEIKPERVADYAGFVCQAAARLKARGTPFAFAIAPSPATIYPEQAPGWALPARTPTEYDLVLERVRSCGVKAIDLRPALRSAKGGPTLYRLTDSHWTMRGALIGFDALVAGLGQPAWRIDVASAGWRMQADPGGDLPRLAGLAPRSETVEVTDIAADPPGSERTTIPGIETKVAPSILLDTKRPGPSVLIIGDSYTEHYFPGFFAHSAGRVGWVHEAGCAFDWRAVAQARPDLVILMPVERFTTCDGGARPAHFDEG